MHTTLLAGWTLLLLTTGGWAQAEEGQAAEPAKELVTRYLSAVKAKNYAEAKKLIHPKTLAVIAERKQRLKREDHPLAPWALEKTDSYLTQFKVESVTPGVNATWVVETREDNYQVQDKGVAEGEMASYLIGKSGGRWFIVDKKRQETFSPTSIKLGYKGYLDPVPSSKDEEE